ncbi:uncharacterized protein Z518_10903 [Rhinocladiella mackenziei CBS 650.93]|uniref:DASH complex subunit DAD3 n=1 Tax=Rhinocladiella mackenziei CBS 650.93 TaxID=1442369 RepID=A0A0D2I9Q4_9EURO|nr:uncharacterized protein Z518_10903 [Rhinocladiella mackenziei CBS 650.93]KIW99975.1 hypothetical protein Z518_10903 [Rhinocladiella mackenziei CBS 650.93]
MDESNTMNTYHDTKNPSLLNLSDPNASIAGVGRGVTPLEQEVLDEYERLARNMKELSNILASLSSGPITLEIAEGLRLLERKASSVYTLMKASVYSIVLQQGQLDGVEGEAGSITDGREQDEDGGR